ncbi:MAG TPA: inositol monophosphatase family protein [Acidimicrobiia bacterium]|jgi:myo-inositol-1(or 4)-monophosphatase
MTPEAGDAADALHEIAVSLAHEVRAAVLPGLGQHASRAAGGIAPGGDVTMAIDEVAEEVIAHRLGSVGDIAYYSEDRGTVRFGNPRGVLVIDPVDGTRPAAAGFEACVVSIAVVPHEHSCFADITSGVIVELKSGTAITARVGRGAQIDGEACAVPTNPDDGDLRALFWGASQRARPSVPVAIVLERLIDNSAMHGGYFDLGSAAFTMTRLVTGQLDAYVDPGARMVAELPALEPRFREIAGGTVGTNFPYDVAAAYLIVREAGGVVTAADGSPLDSVAVVGSGTGFHVSVVAATDAERHARIIGELDDGMARLASWLAR